jgi:uncharacterized protein YdeI (YjbR/CyaY-like superfamily)
MKPTFFESASAFRAWLATHHDTTPALLVGFYKKQSGRPGITYAEALDQALCFGWIDGIRRRVDDRCYTIRFTPRQPRSVWSTVNTAHVARLMKRGLMAPAGLKAFRQRDPARSKLYSYEARSRPLGGAYARTFRANANAWRFFQAQPPGYRRIATWFVMSAKKEETRVRRLSVLIADSERARRIGLLKP